MSVFALRNKKDTDQKIDVLRMWILKFQIKSFRSAVAKNNIRVRRQPRRLAAFLPYWVILPDR